MMADILKVSPPQVKTTHTISRNIPQPQTPFQITDTVKVNNLTTSKEMMKQNQTILSGGGASVLQSLLKDPLGSIRYIQSIYLLQEVMSLLPLPDEMLNEELMRLFSSMLLQPDELSNEMMLQEKYSSLFQGELFDYLRNLVLTSNEDVKDQVHQLLKGLVAHLSKDQIKESLLFQMQEILDEFAGSKFEPDIQQLMERMKVSDQLHQLQEALKELFVSLESSIRYSAKTQSIRSMMQYNLSRLESTGSMDVWLAGFSEMEGVDVETLTQLIHQFLAQREGASSESKVMDTLIHLLKTQIDHATAIGLSKEKIQSIIYSMLASPSHFIPLLHMILPLQFGDMKAYGELWVQSDEGSSDVAEKKRRLHVLLSMEVDKLGHMELELKGSKEGIHVILYVPQPLVPLIKKFEDKVAMIFYDSSYRLQTIRTQEIREPRTLFEVFDQLPAHHMGVNLYV